MLDLMIVSLIFTRHQLEGVYKMCGATISAEILGMPRDSKNNPHDPKNYAGASSIQREMFFIVRTPHNEVHKI